MARPRAPQPVKMFCGVLSGDVDLLRRARQLLARRLGALDLESDVLDFCETDYYEHEMGPNLKRLFVSFDTLHPPDALAGFKHETNDIEQEIAEQCAGLEITRPVNLDPGYVDLAKLVLATTKDRAHRIYIGQCMYAEATLQFKGGIWKPGIWTYPDYLRADYHAFFVRLRDRLREQRRELADQEEPTP